MQRIARTAALIGLLGVVCAPSQASAVDQTVYRPPSRADAVDQPISRFLVRTETEKFDIARLSDKTAKVMLDVPELGVSVIETKLPLADVERELAQPAAEVSPFNVTLFDTTPGCNDRHDVRPGPLQPDNVCRLVGTTPFTPSGATPTVWIIDSGIDQVSTAGLLNVQQAIDCTAVPCVALTGTAKMDDDLGHGTMVAGIVGAKQTLVDGKNVSGVAPGTPIVPVKVFSDTPTADFWGAPLAGLSWVAHHGKTGDIVNLSWGAKWVNAARNRDYQGFALIDQELQVLVKLGLTVVVAAGNAATRNDFAWAGLVLPSNEGAFPFTATANPGPGIYSIAAVSSAAPAAGPWTDDYWAYSAFGANPPNYAEPGVNITSLWPGRKASGTARTNTCSGTSFAAPAFAGLLARRQSLQSATATNDPFPPAKPVAFIDDNGGKPCP